MMETAERAGAAPIAIALTILRREPAEAINELVGEAVGLLCILLSELPSAQ